MDGGNMDKIEKKEAWDVAFALTEVDGLKPSPEMIIMAGREIKGEMTKEEILKILRDKYQSKE